MADEINVIINALLKDKEFKKTIKSMATDMNKGSQKIKKDWSSVVTGWNQGLELVKKIWRGVKSAMNLAKEFAEYKQGMDALTRNTGKNADKMVKKLAEVTKGTVSNKDIMLAANRVVALNVTKDTDKMAKLFEIARLKAKAMGITTSQAVNDIATGIGRQSPLILDNLGIITKGWDKEAKAAGVAMDQQFILNKILADGAKELQKTGARTLTGAERMQQFDAAIENLKISFGAFVKDGIGPAIEFVTKLINKISDLMVTIAELKKADDDTVKSLNKFGIETAKQASNVIKLSSAYESYMHTIFQIKKIQKDLKNAEKFSTEQLEKKRNILNILIERRKEQGKELDKYKKKLEDTEIKTGKQAFDAIKQVNDERQRSIELQEEEVRKSEAQKRAEEEAKKHEERLSRLEEWKTAQVEYYTYIDEQRQIDLLKEQESFDKTTELLDKALSQGVIKREQHNKMIVEAQKKHLKNLEEMNVFGIKIISDAWKGASESIATTYADGMAEMMVSGDIFRKNFGDMIMDLLRMFAKLIFKAIIFKGVMLALGGIGGLFFNKGGLVPNVAYAANGMKARGTDTIPAMLTPNERVLTVDQNRAFEQLLKSLAIPVNTGSNIVNNSTSTVGDTFVTNTFNNEFGSDSIDPMIDFSQRTGSRFLRR